MAGSAFGRNRVARQETGPCRYCHRSSAGVSARTERSPPPDPTGPASDDRFGHSTFSADALCADPPDDRYPLPYPAGERLHCAARSDYAALDSRSTRLLEKLRRDPNNLGYGQQWPGGREITNLIGQRPHATSHGSPTRPSDGRADAVFWATNAGHGRTVPENAAPCSRRDRWATDPDSLVPSPPRVCAAESESKREGGWYICRSASNGGAARNRASSSRREGRAHRAAGAYGKGRMSTILDALRKIERERQGQDGKVRARILVSPPRPLSPTPPHQSLLWTAGMSVLLVGFIVGVWMTRQEEIPSEEGGAPHHLSKEVERRFPPPVVSENFGDSEKTVSAVTGGQIQEKQRRIGNVTDPLLPEHPLVLSEPRSLQNSPFVSPPQVALRTSLVDATPQGFSEPDGERADQAPRKREDSVPHVSETTGEGREITLESGHEKPDGEAERFEREQLIEPEKPADIVESDEPEEIYDPAPANSAISFLQWSPESARRKAFVRVGGSPLTLVHEGDAIGGYTVVEIRPDAVALRSDTTRFQIRVR